MASNQHDPGSTTALVPSPDLRESPSRVTQQSMVLSVGVAVAALTVAGCVSTPIVGSQTGLVPPSGIAYSLPKALLDVTLSDAGGELKLTVGAPEYIADQRYTYLLQYKPDSFASDTVEITVDPKTTLLQTINTTAEDKTADTIIELAKAAALAARSALLAQAAEAPEVVILEQKIDPDDEENVKTLVTRMNTAGASHANQMLAKLSCPVADKTNQAQCDSYRKLSSPAQISFSIKPIGQPTPAVSAVPDCSLGVCYRVLVPYRIDFAFNDGAYAYSTVVNLPNNGQPVVWPLDRTPFVKRVNNAEFENGMLKKVHVEKPSEAVEVASLPVKVVAAIFDSITNLVQFKINLSDKEKALAESQKTLLEAQRTLENARNPVPQSAGNATKALLAGSSGGRTINPRLQEIQIAKPAAPPAGLISPSNPGNPSAGQK